MKSKKLLLLLSLLIPITFISFFAFNSFDYVSLNTKAEISSYSLVLSQTSNHLTYSSNGNSGSSIVKTKLGNDIQMEFNNLSFEDNSWQRINAGGFFYNVDSISGINNIDITFNDYYEQLNLCWSNNGAFSDQNKVSLNSDLNLMVRYDFNNAMPNYVKISAPAGCSLASISFNFSCFDYHNHNSSHSVVHHEAKEPTCDETGNYEYDTCLICDYSTYVEIPALGHDYNEIIDVNATNDHVGRKHDECSRCGKTINYSTIRRNGISYIEIASFNDFASIPNNTTNNYFLVNDIDFSGKVWTPITFKGIFDGAYHIISNTSKYLFANNYGTIENCHIVNNALLNSEGSFAVHNYGIIDFCSFEGSISKETSGYTYVGGFVGINSGTISNSYFVGNVNGISNSNGSVSGAGGLVGKNSDGENENSAVVTNCYAKGSIESIGSSCSGYAGGILGYNYHGYKEVSRCYFSGNVHGETTNSNSSYSAGAGAIIGGYNSGTNCYYNNSSITVTKGSIRYNGQRIDDYELMVSTALGESDLFNYCPKNSHGDPVLPNSNESGEATLSAINLSEEHLVLSLNEQRNIVATIVPSSAASIDDLVWESSNESVATVKNGLVSALSYGTATITVSCKNISAQCLVEVLQTIPVQSVSLNSTSIIFNSTSFSSTLTATVLPQNATNKNVTWSSSNSSVATVSSSGVVTPKAAGTATITVRTVDGGKTATCNVTVNVEQLSISLSSSYINLSVGQSLSIAATISPSSVTGKTVSWSSSSSSVASVNGTMITNNTSSGTITALREGTTTITASVGSGVSAQCTVVVSGSSSSSTMLTTSNYSQYLNLSVSASNNGTTGSGINTYKVIRYTATVSVKSGRSIVSNGSIRISITTTSYSGSNAQTSHTTSITISLQSGETSFSGSVNETLSYAGTSTTYNYTKTVTSISGSAR